MRRPGPAFVMRIIVDANDRREGAVMIEAILALSLASASPAAPPCDSAPLQLAQMQQQQRRLYDYSGLRREELRREEQQREGARLEDLRRQDQTRQIWQGERSRLDVFGSQVESEQRQLDLERRQLDIERMRLQQQPGN
jgi:hypothetical protein